MAIEVDVGADAVPGSVIAVGIDGAPQAERAALAERVHERANPLVMRHEIAWT